ncbi:MAG TPA: hypothetical protein VLJ79_22695 [Candidatus Binatia bacterium]|nr:hypothetical protein [Candidatus Binatia bacterium]
MKVIWLTTYAQGNDPVAIAGAVNQINVAIARLGAAKIVKRIKSISRKGAKRAK